MWLQYCDNEPRQLNVVNASSIICNLIKLIDHQPSFKCGCSSKISEHFNCMAPPTLLVIGGSREALHQAGTEGGPDIFEIQARTMVGVAEKELKNKEKYEDSLTTLIYGEFPFYFYNNADWDEVLDDFYSSTNIPFDWFLATTYFSTRGFPQCIDVMGRRRHLRCERADVWIHGAYCMLRYFYQLVRKQNMVIVINPHPQCKEMRDSVYRLVQYNLTPTPPDDVNDLPVPFSQDQRTLNRIDTDNGICYTLESGMNPRSSLLPVNLCQYWWEFLFKVLRYRKTPIDTRFKPCFSPSDVLYSFCDCVARRLIKPRDYSPLFDLPTTPMLPNPRGLEVPLWNFERLQPLFKEVH